MGIKINDLPLTSYASSEDKLVVETSQGTKKITKKAFIDNEAPDPVLDIKWELGVWSIDSSSIVFKQNAFNRVRSTEIIPIEPGCTINVTVESGYKFSIGFIDNNGKRTSETGWTTTSISVAVPEPNITIILSDTANSNITDIDELVSKFSFELVRVETGLFRAEYKVSTYEEIKEQFTKGKIVYFIYNDAIYYLNKVSATELRFSERDLTNANNIRVTSSNTWLSSWHGLQATNEKVQTITAEVTTAQYPSAKAVFDFVTGLFANKFDSSIATQGQRVAQSGGTTADANYFISDYIPVEPGYKYKFNFVSSVYNRVAEYDDNKTFIQKIDSEAVSEIKVSSTTKFIRFSNKIELLNSTEFKFSEIG